MMMTTISTKSLSMPPKESSNDYLHSIPENNLSLLKPAGKIFKDINSLLKILKHFCEFCIYLVTNQRLTANVSFYTSPNRLVYMFFCILVVFYPLDTMF